MPLGASITNGVGSSTGNGYRAELLRRLTQAGVAVDFVGSQQSGDLPDRDNEGHSGWRIDQVAAQLDGWLATYRPDVVLVHVGTNDMLQNHQAATAPERLGALVDRILERSPGTTVLTSSLLPLRDAAAGARVDAFNAAVADLMARKAAQGRAVRHVDLRGAVAVGDLADGIHPGDAGFARMGALFHAALGPVLGAGAPWPLVRSGLEADDPPTWTDTVAGASGVGGYCCGLTAMESGRRVELAHTGTGALMYSGDDRSATVSYSYNRVFDVHVPVTAATVLRYRILPQQAAGASVAIDLAMTDRSSLRDSGATDQHGVRAHPAAQGAGGHLVTGRWNLVEVPLGVLAGRTVDEIRIGYDRPGGTGLFRGYVDDIEILDTAG
ncbi:SGNH/GDSL hydrolase family protein [Spirilliplanes yamanashiensis]|nr:SGNH/GDSL hydrolase family protein [Spirilliplanes yamanashiensis]MDP9817301.1 lysophospholipase L1-like esterase [Spirilliplanes yamanashiensis]